MPMARGVAGQSWFRETIAGKITARMLALASIPVLAVGAMTTASLFILADQADDQLETSQTELARQTIGGVRADQTRLFIGQLDRFIGERFDDLIDWSEEDVVVDATLADYERVPEISKWTPQVIEAQLSSRDQLDGRGTTPRYLFDRIGDRSTYTSMLLTDGNGFTLSTTETGAAFLHSNEGWWQAAWANGAYVGPIETDQLGRSSFRLAVRVDGEIGGRASGVLLALVDAAALQPLADEFANDEQQVDFWLVTEDGRLVIETASDHDADRVGADVDLEAGIDELYQQAVADGTSGALVTETGVGGYGWTAPTRSLDRLNTEVETPRLLAFSEQPMAAALAPLGSLDNLGSDLGTAAVTIALAVAALIAITLLLAFWASRLLANQITEPLRTLGAEARRMSETELPSLVHTLRSTDGSGEVPVVDLIDIDADEEVAELAGAFNALRATTVELAATQAIDRSKDLAAVLVNLGRRNQHLIGRQLQFIDRLEATESDPDALQNLFTLDQMATRMRRNAESLLVLAGERVPRQASQHQPVHDVLRAAAGEVEHFARVSLSSIEPALIVPQAASDLTHLLAELIENATHFSPLDTTVEVVGSWDDRSCYTVSVIDHGPGMSRLKLSEANARISQAVIDETPTSYLGLFVVGRLAARHNIDARLIESAGMGTTAKVTLPARCVTAMLEIDDEAPGDEAPVSEEAAPRNTSWPLPQRVSLPVPAPEHSGRHPKVPEHITADTEPDPLMIEEIEEALELPEHTEELATPEPTAQGAERNGDTADDEATVDVTGEPVDSETEGLPIPPFRARRSKISTGPAGAADAIERSHPSNPAFRQAGRNPGGTHLEIVTSLPEVDVKTRATEVKERLSRFSEGVAAAKAKVPPSHRETADAEAESPTDVVPFRQRPKSGATVSSTNEEDPS